MPRSSTSTEGGPGGRASGASRGLLPLANGLLGVILVTIGVVEWVRGAPFGLTAIARMGVFVGIAAMGFTQLAAARAGAGEQRPRPALAAATWTLAWAATYLVLVIA